MIMYNNSSSDPRPNNSLRQFIPASSWYGNVLVFRVNGNNTHIPQYLHATNEDTPLAVRCITESMQ
jgi:hypothetical protein